MQTYSGIITHLDTKDIFTFGSNLNGFHGAGSAGFATFGVSGNRWRDFNYQSKPDGWRGLWTVKGHHEGLQHGTHGWSYALPTVTRPGAKRSRSVSQISASIKQLYVVAERNPTWRFLIAFGTGHSLNGYSNQELADMFSHTTITSNIVFEINFSKLIT